MRSATFVLLISLYASLGLHAEGGHPPPISSEELAARRTRVLESMRKDAKDPLQAVLVLRSPKPDHFAGDVDYLYRPDNDLFYLTGIEEDHVALILSRDEIDGVGHAMLFVKEATERSKVWHGDRLGRDGASRRSGIDRKTVFEEKDFTTKLRELLGSSARVRDAAKRRLWLDLGPKFAPGEPPTGPHRFLVAQFGSAAFDFDLRSSRRLIAPHRQIKSTAEVAHLRKAIDTTCVALENAMRSVHAGIWEYELRAVIEGTFLRHGCPGPGFPSIVGSGPNSCVLHYHKYGRQSRAGEVVLLDVGAEYGNYSADITRTIPIDGKFTKRQRAIYEVVLKAQKAAIEAIKPGAKWDSVQRKAMHKAGEELAKIGVIETPRDVKQYYLHGCSHGLGLAVHDAMPSRTLAAGMVITIEPGLYFPEEGLGIRIEDDVLVTKNGYEILSASVPKEIDEIEAYMESRDF